MKVKSSKFGQRVAILAADLFKAVPIRCVGFSPVKAGTPLTAAGAAALDGTGAAGILLYDVDPAENPNGAMVVQGVVDYAKAKDNAGITATAAVLQALMPDICFRTYTGTEEEEGDEMIVHFTVSLDEQGVISAVAEEDFSDVWAAVQNEKIVMAKVELPEGSDALLLANLNIIVDNGDIRSLVFVSYADFADDGESPEPEIYSITFTEQGCAVKTTRLTPVEG